MNAVLATDNAALRYNKSVLSTPSRRMPMAHARKLGFKKPVVTENLLDDIYYCAEWAEQNYTIVEDHKGEPMFLLTSEKVHSALAAAASSLTASSAFGRQCWSIEDLIARDNFARFCERHAVYDNIRIVIQIAKDWVRVSTDTLATMEASAGFVVRF